MQQPQNLSPSEPQTQKYFKMANFFNLEEHPVTVPD
jgi:hypothetical protein